MSTDLKPLVSTTEVYDLVYQLFEQHSSSSKITFLNAMQVAVLALRDQYEKDRQSARVREEADLKRLAKQEAEIRELKAQIVEMGRMAEDEQQSP